MADVCLGEEEAIVSGKFVPGLEGLAVLLLFLVLTEPVYGIVIRRGGPGEAGPRGNGMLAAKELTRP